MTKTIETRKNSRGHMVRIQQRGAKFDVTYNSNGITWRYKAKSVDAQTARFTFDLECM